MSSFLTCDRVVANDLQTDPDGDYIRCFIPEVKDLRGKGTSLLGLVSTTAITEIAKLSSSHTNTSVRESWLNLDTQNL